MSGAMRHELKYYLPVSAIPEIRGIIDNHVVHDPYCASLQDNSYVVRSIYFDSADMIFYYEKIDSVKARRKLRIRTYNELEAGSVAFIEIKRKFGTLGCKDRLCLPIEKVDGAINGKDPSKVLEDVNSFRNRKVLEKIRYLMHVKDLRPVVLVTYDREAFIGCRDTTARVTFDCNIRSMINPRLEQIFSEKTLLQFEDNFFVLELKYDEYMPQWMAGLITKLGLSRESYSKYCRGIEAWARDQEHELSALNRHAAEG